MPQQPPDSPRAQVEHQMDANPEAADVALSAVDELAATGAETDRLRAEVRELNEQLLRRAAEFQNYRRRTDAELGGAAERGRAEVAERMLDVLDDLRRSLDAAGRAAKQSQSEGIALPPAFEALGQGVDLVYRKFTDELARLGVEPVSAVGQPFSEELHEAVMQQPAPDAATPSGTVLAELQPGYRMGERVLRHAKVIVAK